mmetsp:Transcript_2687/g.5873  ORF Transcript_2687/g.5873 Transcript_2687/m.5873 type:complete len:85 (-) Transcript_2687:48-302(-)
MGDRRLHKRLAVNVQLRLSPPPVCRDIGPMSESATPARTHPSASQPLSLVQSLKSSLHRGAEEVHSLPLLIFASKAVKSLAVQR